MHGQKFPGQYISILRQALQKGFLQGRKVAENIIATLKFKK